MNAYYGYNKAKAASQKARQQSYLAKGYYPH